MDWLKINEDGEVELVSEEIKLVPELQVLNTLNYNKGKRDADGRKKYRFKEELKYMYLAYSYKSPYRDYSDTERVDEAKLDCKFSSDWKESTELKSAIAKYQKAIPNKVMRLLKTTEKFLDKFEGHLNGIDLNERNAAGGIVHKPTEIMATLERLPRLAETLFELENQAKQGVISKVSSKGDHEVGWMAINKSKNGKSNTATEEGDKGEV